MLSRNFINIMPIFSRKSSIKTIIYFRTIINKNVISDNYGYGVYGDPDSLMYNNIVGSSIMFSILDNIDPEQDYTTKAKMVIKR